MLTSTQCRTVAYIDEGGFYCPNCAAEKWGVQDKSTGEWRMAAATAEHPNPSAVMEYELDIHTSETEADYIAEGYSPAAASEMAAPTCEGCCEALDC